MRRRNDIETDIKYKENALKINKSMIIKLTTEISSVENKIKQIDKSTSEGKQRSTELNKHADKLESDLKYYIKEQDILSRERDNLLNEMDTWKNNEYRKIEKAIQEGRLI